MPTNHHDFPGPMPTTDAELLAWVRRWIGVSPPARALLDGHQAPLAYLAHAFFEDRVPRDCVVWANRGGGKTFLAAVATALDLIFKPTIEIRILAGSVEQAGRMHTHLRDIFDREPFNDLVSGKATERRLTLTNGSTAELLAQSQTSVRGTRVQKLRCDEVELFDPEVWRAAQLTTRSKQCGPVPVRGTIECLSTMHVPYGLMHDLVARTAEPGGPHLFRWGVVDVLDHCDDRHECLTCALAPECAGLAKARAGAGDPPGHIAIDDALTLKSRVDTDTWNAEMLCLRPKRSDCVLPEFDARVHAVDRPPLGSEAWPVIAGMDFGIRSPTVFLWARLAPDGSVCVVREHIRAGLTLPEHLEHIAAAPLKPVWVGIDPAGVARNSHSGVSDADKVRSAGLQPRWVRGPIHEGISLIRARLRSADGRVRLTVTQDCPELIKSLERYHYPDNPETDTPEKDGHDHAVDALRYMIINLDRPYKTEVSCYAR